MLLHEDLCLLRLTLLVRESVLQAREARVTDAYNT